MQGKTYFYWGTRRHSNVDVGASGIGQKILSYFGIDSFKALFKESSVILECKNLALVVI